MRDWPIIWICPVCERQYEGQGYCTAYRHNSEGHPSLLPMAIPPAIYDAAKALQRIAGLWQIAAPPECVVEQAEAIAREKGWLD